MTADDAAFVVALHAAPHARAHVHAPNEDRLRAAASEPDHEGRIILDYEGTPVGFWSLSVHDGGWLVELVRIVAIPRRGHRYVQRPLRLRDARARPRLIDDLHRAAGDARAVVRRW